MYPAGVPSLATRFIKTRSGVRVRVVESGSETGPPVLLLPGWGASIYLYRKNIAALVDAGLRAIAVDLQGQGLSDKPVDPAAYTLPRMTAHAMEIMDALAIDRARIVGQSMAGKIAAQLALERPERVERLALISAVGIGRIPGAALLALLPLRAMDHLPAAPARWVFWAVLRRAYGSVARPTARDVDEYYAAAGDPNFVRALFLLLREFDWRPIPLETIATLAMRLLIVAGSDDRVVTPDRVPRVAECVPGARSLVVAGAGHVPNEEAPDAVNRALVDFLAAP
jgi:pimeloyl-ACP methyl ester carboxylesterase